jgi:hypothetical protein
MPYFQREDIRYVLTRGQQGVKPAFCSIYFPHGGWSIMRSAYEEKPYENARHLTFHTSQGAHGHRDINAITVYAYGRELLIDPGIRSYEAADLERFPTVPYHNTVTVDGQSYAAKAGTTEKWISNDGIDYVVGSHKNYAGLVHRRTVLFVKPEYWIILDDVLGEGRHTYDQNWHFALDAGITEEPVRKAIRTGYPTGGNLLIIPANPSELESKPTEFYVATKRMAGESQGQARAQGWRYTKSDRAPQTFPVVLYPYAGPVAPPVSIAPLDIVDADSAARPNRKSEIRNPKSETNSKFGIQTGKEPEEASLPANNFDDRSTEVRALAVTIKDRTDYVLISWTGPRKMMVPSLKLTIEAEIAVIRMNGRRVESLRGERITGPPDLGR